MQSARAEAPVLPLLWLSHTVLLKGSVDSTAKLAFHTVVKAVSRRPNPHTWGAWQSFRELLKGLGQFGRGDSWLLKSLRKFGLVPGVLEILAS